MTGYPGNTLWEWLQLLLLPLVIPAILLPAQLARQPALKEEGKDE